ncbi:hypothetical protein TNCV_4094801 [Trichonephila clavipes]|uniref:Uncharacterized protein n=1 Tax=Trichonephila clavipes TaxID=2585209 RepID=A0A8X6VIV4_TRICX|nr:hypothetical protein TNCV_4094801 [Trichonephila clavipes]
MSTVPGAKKCGNVPMPIQVQYINSGAIRFRHQFSAVGYPFSCALGEINCKDVGEHEGLPCGVDDGGILCRS